MKAPKTLLEAVQYFSDEQVCIDAVAMMRWPQGVRCGYCDADQPYYLKTQKRWKCRSCRKQFSVKVNSIFEDSPIRLQKWLPALWRIVNCKNGVSSYEIARDLGVTQKTAWFMLQRLRLALNAGNGFDFKLGGTGGPVEVDETFIGPKPLAMHRDRRLKLKVGENGYADKVAVFGALDRETRQVRAKVVPNVKRETLQNEILNQIEGKSTVYSAGWRGYTDLAARDFIHAPVNPATEYVNGQVHTQGIENFWSLLKRGLKGTCVAVEPFHLDRYIDEQVFRFNHRATKDNPLDDADRFYIALAQVAHKRLTY